MIRSILGVLFIFLAVTVLKAQQPIGAYQSGFRQEGNRFYFHHHQRQGDDRVLHHDDVSRACKLDGRF